MKYYKILFLFLLFVEFSYARHLKVAVISDEFTHTLNKKVILETNKLFSYDDKITFSQYKTSNKIDFLKTYYKISTDSNIDVVIVIGEENGIALQKKEVFPKKSILISSLGLNKNEVLHKKNLLHIDYSRYNKDIDFIKNSLHIQNIKILNNTSLNAPYDFKKDELVYISSLSLYNKKKLEELIKYLNKNKIKSFYTGNTDFLKNNSLFSNQKINTTRIARTLALQVYKLLNADEKLVSYIKINSSSEIIFDEQIALNISFDIPFILLAQVISTNSQMKIRKINLKDAFKLVLNKSYSHKIARQSLEIQKQNLSQAYNAYKPNIYADVSYDIVDEDRAKSSGGILSEYTLHTGLNARQLLYSVKSYKNIEVQKNLIDSKEHEIKAIKDKILYVVILKYLNTLHLQKSYEIIQIKHSFTKKNLALAQNRLSIGLSDRSDVYRWKSEIANVNIQLLNAKLSLNKQKMELSNLLQIPNKEAISLQEYTLDNDLFTLFGQTPALLVVKQKKLNQLSLLLSSTVVEKHNILQQYTQLISAKKKQISALKYNRYLPRILLNANINETLDKQGEGSDIDNTLDDTQYKISLYMKIPIYESGTNSVGIEKYKLELLNLYNIFNNKKSQIQTNLYKDIASISSSYSAINFSSLAYINAEKNYNLIQDKYSKGEANILSLLDSQNSMIISKMRKHSSVYTYLSNISSIFYTIGFIDSFYDENKKNKLQSQLKKVL